MGLLRQQYDSICSHFSQHVLHLHDLFSEGVKTREDEFDLAASLAAPAMPLAPASVRNTEDKFNMIFNQFTSMAEAEIQRFVSDSFAIKHELEAVVMKAEAATKQAERRRYDEFVHATNLCRREVSATVALLKSEQAQSATEVSGMNALRSSLDEVVKELDVVRAKAARQQAEQHVAAVKQRTELLHELETQRQAFETERTEVAERIRMLITSHGVTQSKYSMELAKLAQDSADRVSELHSRITNLQSELESATSENSRLQNEMSRRERDHGFETLNLKRQIGSLELDNERMRLVLESEREQHSFATHDVRVVLDARRNVEVEQFKRRLIESVSTGGGAGHQPGVSLSLTPSERGASAVRSVGAMDTFASPNAARGQLAAASSASLTFGSPLESSRSPGMLLGFSPQRQADAQPAASRGPSDAYLRLQNLAASWKDRLSPGRAPSI